jgi:hypothetical protein
MSYLGHGIYAELSVIPDPVKRGDSGSYSVKIKNGKTVDSEIMSNHSIMGLNHLEFTGRSPGNSWLCLTQIPRASEKSKSHALSVIATIATEEFVECLSVERRDPVLIGPWESCTLNIPIAIRLKIT